MKIHILCGNMKSPNGKATIFPIIAHHRLITRFGHQVTFSTTLDGGQIDSDILCVELKHLTHLRKFTREESYSFIEDLSKKSGTLWFFDNSDSTTLSLPEILPFVDAYLTNQAFHDRKLHLNSFEGRTAFTEYYSNQRFFSSPHRAPPALAEDMVRNPRDLAKIFAAWNSGLSDHSPSGHTRLKRIKTLSKITPRFALKQLLHLPRALAEPGVDRPISYHCRMNLSYHPPIFSAQRKLVAQILGLADNSVKKLDRKSYFEELCRSWAVISPFGYGEITLKDFESFLCGNVLIKPDMSHVDTWPPFYEAWRTYVPIKWDLSDLPEIVEDVIVNRKKYIHIAAEGQKRYLEYISGPHSGFLFAKQFDHIVSRALICNP